MLALKEYSSSRVRRELRAPRVPGSMLGPAGLLPDVLATQQRCAAIDGAAASMVAAAHKRELCTVKMSQE